jgi:ribosomal protein S18 acetylase RimI-like enzyme
MIIEVTDNALKQQYIQDIIKTLPEWFGREEANEKYKKDIVDKIVFAFLDDEICKGLIAVENLFEQSCNIWWLGVNIQSHGKNIGRQLIKKAESYAQDKNLSYLVLETVHPCVNDGAYNKTIKFYYACGFKSIIQTEMSSKCPMMWMVKTL